MWEINFYLLPAQSYRGIDLDTALDFGDRIQEIKKTDEVMIPNSFFEVSDKEGMCAGEYLYEKNQSDVVRYLQEVIKEQKISDDTYEEIYENNSEKGYVVISEKDILPDASELCVLNTDECYQDGEIIPGDVIRIKRIYLARAKSYEEYVNKMPDCFPQLFFYEGSSDNIQKLGKIAEVNKELSRHLSALNDYGKRIYDECAGNEENALHKLKSTCDITCSGKGSKETLSFKKKICYQDKEYTISCNSHTKFLKGNNDQRIYFSWGRDEIQNHNLIIMSIGRHWEKDL